MPTEFELKLSQLRNCMVVVAFHEIVAAHNAAIAALEAERDALRKDAERLDFLDKWVVIYYKPDEPIRAAIDRERAAIAAKEPK